MILGLIIGLVLGFVAGVLLLYWMVGLDLREHESCDQQAEGK
jgi:F0F1-type ATP synthase assembly protein I